MQKTGLSKNKKGVSGHNFKLPGTWHCAESIYIWNVDAHFLLIQCVFLGYHSVSSVIVTENIVGTENHLW